MVEAFYTREGDEFAPTRYCIGPWSEQAQHGGPPSALLAGAVEAYGEGVDDFTVTRVTVELIRPVPLTPLHIEVEPLRLGRQVQWLSASLKSEGVELARASVVRIRTQGLDLPATAEPPRPAPSPPPEQCEEATFDFFTVDVAYHRAIDMRRAAGTWGQGPVTAWLRPRFPLVAGETTTPLERTMLLADATNGVSPALSPEEYAFINPEITVYLQRPVTTAWLALEARSVPGAEGVGLVQSTIYDESGEAGRCIQSLMIRPR